MSQGRCVCSCIALQLLLFALVVLQSCLYSIFCQHQRWREEGREEGRGGGGEGEKGECEEWREGGREGVRQERREGGRKSEKTSGSKSRENYMYIHNLYGMQTRVSLSLYYIHAEHIMSLHTTARSRTLYTCVFYCTVHHCVYNCTEYTHDSQRE